MTGRWWRGGVLALGLLGLPAAGWAQGWPLQTGPGGDAVTQSATALPEPLPMPRPGAAPGWAGWTPPPLPQSLETRRSRAAVPGP